MNGAQSDPAGANSEAEELQKLRKLFDERLDARDGTIALIKEMSESLRKQNESLDKQFTFRWNVLVFITGFLPLLLGTAFAYQVYKGYELQKLHASLQHQTTQFQLATESYSKVLAMLANADELVTQGYREFQRDGFSDAAAMSSEAISKLKEALALTGVVEEKLMPSELKWSTCEPVFGRNDPSQEGYDASLFSTKNLRQPVINALFNAHDLLARSLFFSNRLNTDALYNQGRILTGLDRLRWEGYHWLGLAQLGEDEKSYADRKELQKSAKVCFKKSVSLHEDRNKDWVNLAELAVAEGKYAEGNNYAREFLYPNQPERCDFPVRFRSPVEVIAYFYRLVSEEELRSQNSKEPCSVDEYSSSKTATFIKLFAGMKENLQGTFSFVTLSDFIERQKLRPEDQIAQMYYCLKDQKCGERHK